MIGRSWLTKRRRGSVLRAPVAVPSESSTEKTFKVRLRIRIFGQIQLPRLRPSRFIVRNSQAFPAEASQCQPKPETPVNCGTEPDEKEPLRLFAARSGLVSRFRRFGSLQRRFRSNRHHTVALLQSEVAVNFCDNIGVNFRGVFLNRNSPQRRAFCFNQ